MPSRNHGVLREEMRVRTETPGLSPDRILLIRLRELGDTLLMTPLVRQAARIHPQAEIDVVCQSSNRCVFACNPAISRTFIMPRHASVTEFLSIASELRRRRYDLVIDLQGLPKTALLARLTCGRERAGFRNRGWRNGLCYTQVHPMVMDEYAARRNLRLLADDRVDFDDLDLDFPVHPDVETAADAFCRKYFRPPVAAIFGICRFGRRAWAADKTAAVADRLAGLGLQPWLVYGPGEEDAARRIAERMRHPALLDYEMPSFTELRALLARCRLFFGNDGGPKHVAVAAGTPTVTVYHAGQAVRWSPARTHRHRVVCTRPRPGASAVIGRVTDAASIDKIPIAAVWSEIEAALEQPAPPRDQVFPH